MSKLITSKQADVLNHASRNGRYVTDEAEVIAMADLGLLRDYGPQRLAGEMHYLVTTPLGRAALNEWNLAQPKPPKLKKKRRSAAFEAWESFCDGFSRISFRDFLKDKWVHRRDWGL